LKQILYFFILCSPVGESIGTIFTKRGELSEDKRFSARHITQEGTHGTINARCTMKMHEPRSADDHQGLNACCTIAGEAEGQGVDLRPWGPFSTIWRQGFSRSCHKGTHERSIKERVIPLENFPSPYSINTGLAKIDIFLNLRLLRFFTLLSSSFRILKEFGLFSYSPLDLVRAFLTIEYPH
jgi:hypothetical protein